MTSSSTAPDPIYVLDSDTEDDTPIGTLYGVAKRGPRATAGKKPSSKRQSSKKSSPKSSSKSSIAVLSAMFPEMYSQTFMGTIYRYPGDARFSDTVYVKLDKPSTSRGTPTCRVGYRQHAGTISHDPCRSTTFYQPPKVYVATNWSVKCFPGRNKLIATDPDARTKVSSRVHIDLSEPVNPGPTSSTLYCD